MYISSMYYNKQGNRKVAACIYYHFIITRKDEEKLRYVYISLYYNKERQRNVAVRMKKSVGVYISPFIRTRNDKEMLR